MRSSDDGDWPVHSLMLSFHDNEWTIFNNKRFVSLPKPEVVCMSGRRAADLLVDVARRILPNALKLGSV